MKKKLLIVGYGIITKELVHKFEDSFQIYVLSHHLDPKSIHSNFHVLRKFSGNYDIILSCGPSNKIINFWKNNSVLKSISKNKTYCIEMGTLNMTTTRKWTTLVNDIGGNAIECPFTGSQSGAHKGLLSLFVCIGDTNVEIIDFLSIFSKKIYLFDDYTYPTKFKLYYNAWGASILRTLSYFNPERFFSGKELDMAKKIVTNDGWMSLVCKSKLSRISNHTYQNPEFQIKHMIKDLNYFHEIADSNEISNLIEFYEQFRSFEGDQADFSIVGDSKYKL